VKLSSPEHDCYWCVFFSNDSMITTRWSMCALLLTLAFASVRALRNHWRGSYDLVTR
jgi:hypothetical protein